MKNSFLLYTDLWHTLKYCNDENLGKLTRLIFEYETNGTTIDVEHPLFFLFNPIKVQLDRDKEKYESIIESRSIAGKASAAKRGRRRNKDKHLLTDDDTCQQDDTNPTLNENESVSVNYKKINSEDFKKELAMYRGEFSDEMLRQFFIYWSEEDSKGKMRMQLQKTWTTRNRLVRWQLNNKQESKQQASPEPKSRAWTA